MKKIRKMGSFKQLLAMIPGIPKEIKDIDIDEVMAGLQIQLLTYMDAVTKIEDFMPAGVLYFSLIEPTITGIDRNNTSEDIEKLIKKKFRMKFI